MTLQLKTLLLRLSNAYKTVMNYLTTGLGIGITARAVLPRKDKNKNNNKG
jgi:hypothetical protein